MANIHRPLQYWRATRLTSESPKRNVAGAESIPNRYGGPPGKWRVSSLQAIERPS